jgi:tRNA (cytidine/uridine-2'-O-)-methyltransferase
MNIVLVNPEIPQNTGTIARTCAATRTNLHLVKPFAFDISEKALRRAGLDYWPLVPLIIHESILEFLQHLNSSSETSSSRPASKPWLITSYGSTPYTKVDFGKDDYLIFGNESSGLPERIITTFPKEQQIYIPMIEKRVRCLNLSNAANIILYEARRQLNLDEDIEPRTKTY